MPLPRKQPLQRKVTTFADIGPGERVRWGLGQILIEGTYTPNRRSEGPALPSWPSWKAFFEAYQAVRSEYLDWYRDVHGADDVPGVEHLRVCYQRGGDPARCEIPREPDPRLLFA